MRIFLILVLIFTSSLVFAENKYSWIDNNEIKRRVIDIEAPKGFKRLKVKKGSFADWLRHLPLKEKSAKVYLHNGKLKFKQFVHHSVLDIDIGKRDLQQCADAVMRLRAEYFYSKKHYKNISFKFTSGDKYSFNNWINGKYPVIKKKKLAWKMITKKSRSYKSFRKYMDMIFIYSGTFSLNRDSKKVKLKNLKIGDFFIKGGFPGHAVIVLDMLINDKGEKLYLVAQSYMPAQNIHILKNFNNEKLSPWYKLNKKSDLEIVDIITPEWTFTSEQVHRF